VSANEIAAAALADSGKVLNPQQQFAVTWPNAPAVAAAYVDQLSRDRTLDPGRESELRAALALAQTFSDKPAAAAEKAALARQLESLAVSLRRSPAAGGRDSEREVALSAVLEELAAKFR
jgi:hypothetical protein